MLARNRQQRGYSKQFDSSDVVDIMYNFPNFGLKTAGTYADSLRSGKVS